MDGDSYVMTEFESFDENPNENQFQLKRARLIFSGSAVHVRFQILLSV